MCDWRFLPRREIDVLKIIRSKNVRLEVLALRPYILGTTNSVLISHYKLICIPQTHLLILIKYLLYNYLLN